jgi:hypothetical protein
VRLLRLILEPNVTYEKTLAFPPMREFPLDTLNPLPQRANFLRLMLEPICRQSKTDALPPTRDAVLMLMELPMWT